MTTVVWDKRSKMLASDSQMTETTESGGARKYKVRKLYELKIIETDKVIRRFVGLAGDQFGLKFVEWVRQGMIAAARPDFGDKADFSAIVVTIVEPYGLKPRIVAADFYDSTCEPEPIMEDYAAIGSGAKAALVLLDQGMAPADVIRAVARRCPYTDSDVQTLTV